MRLSKPGIVNVYEIGDMSEYRVKTFEDTDREWLQFVIDCRNGKDIYRDCDAVIGNVGGWRADAKWNQLSFKKNDQIAFLTQEIIDGIIAFTESYGMKSW